MSGGSQIKTTITTAVTRTEMAHKHDTATRYDDKPLQKTFDHHEHTEKSQTTEITTTDDDDDVGSNVEKLKSQGGVKEKILQLENNKFKSALPVMLSKQQKSLADLGEKPPAVREKVKNFEGQIMHDYAVEAPPFKVRPRAASPAKIDEEALEKQILTAVDVELEKLISHEPPAVEVKLTPIEALEKRLSDADIPKEEICEKVCLKRKMFDVAKEDDEHSEISLKALDSDNDLEQVAKRAIASDLDFLQKQASFKEITRDSILTVSEDSDLIESLPNVKDVVKTYEQRLAMSSQETSPYHVRKRSAVRDDEREARDIADIDKFVLSETDVVIESLAGTLAPLQTANIVEIVAEKVDSTMPLEEVQVIETLIDKKKVSEITEEIPAVLSDKQTEDNQVRYAVIKEPKITTETLENIIQFQDQQLIADEIPKEQKFTAATKSDIHTKTVKDIPKLLTQKVDEVGVDEATQKHIQYDMNIERLKDNKEQLVTKNLEEVKLASCIETVDNATICDTNQFPSEAKCVIDNINTPYEDKKTVDKTERKVVDITETQTTNKHLTQMHEINICESMTNTLSEQNKTKTEISKISLHAETSKEPTETQPTLEQKIFEQNIREIEQQEIANLQNTKQTLEQQIITKHIDSKALKTIASESIMPATKPTVPSEISVKTEQTKTEDTNTAKKTQVPYDILQKDCIQKYEEASENVMNIRQEYEEHKEKTTITITEHTFSEKTAKLLDVTKPIPQEYTTDEEFGKPKATDIKSVPPLIPSALKSDEKTSKPEDKPKSPLDATKPIPQGYTSNLSDEEFGKPKVTEIKFVSPLISSAVKSENKISKPEDKLKSPLDATKSIPQGYSSDEFDEEFGKPMVTDIKSNSPLIPSAVKLPTLSLFRL
ncbi:uncharacterized protein [Eurosta solidaginis]|uniref:uncharacterized protein n=1 Tax=Eurosta solidaginis TaxID=178769 RepID=UPI00353161B0